MTTCIVQIARRITQIPTEHSFPRDHTPDAKPGDLFGYSTKLESRYHTSAPLMAIQLDQLHANMDQLFNEPVAGVRINGVWFARATESQAMNFELEFKAATDALPI